MKGSVTMVISSNRLQSAYNTLYVNLRNYIWDFNIVEAIADLEVSVYRAFPDINDVKQCIDNLKSMIISCDILSDDEKLKSAFDDFYELLNDADSIYLNLQTFKKVVVV